MRVPWRRLTWVLIAAIPIVAIVGVVWVATRDLSRYQARLTEQIRKVTGRELAAKVPLAVKLGSEPAMVAEGVTLSNASWGSRPDMARVRKLTLYIDPVSLFLGEIKIGRIVLEGADILVETNDVGDANLEMLPPPDGSGPHAGENRSFRLRTTNGFPWIGTIDVRDSVLTIAEKEGRPPVVLEIPSATLRSSAPNQPLQIEGRFAVPHATPLELTGTAGSFDGWMRGLPGNIDVQGGFGGGKIAIKGGVGVKGTTVQINSEGPDVSVFGPYIHLPVPTGGPYVLSAKAATQRSAFKVDVTTLKVGSSELTADVLFRVDRKGTATVTLNADVSRLDLADLHAAPPAPAAASAPSPAQPRLVPTMPFSATWLGRSTLSVTARLGEVVGLGSKVQNASITLTSSETRFAFRAAATVGSGSAGFDLAYDPTGRFGQATLTASANRVPLGDLSSLLGLDLGLRDAVADIDVRLRGGGRTTRDALNSASGSIDIIGRQGRLAARSARQLAGGDAAPAGRRHRWRAVQLHRRPLRRERRRGVAATAGRRHAARRPCGGRLRPAAHGGLGIHPGARSARQPERGPRLAAAPEGRQRPPHDGRAGARSCPADRPGRHRSQPGGADQPRVAPGRRQCLRRGGAAGRGPAAGFARPAAGAHRGRCAPALGTPSEPEPDRETRPPALSHLVDREAGGISARNAEEGELNVAGISHRGHAVATIEGSCGGLGRDGDAQPVRRHGGRPGIGRRAEADASWRRYGCAEDDVRPRLHGEDGARQ